MWGEEMIKSICKYCSKLIIPVCLIIGLVRQGQIQTYQTSIGKPTMTGAFTLYSYIFVGICLTLTIMLSNFVGRSKLGNALKMIFRVIVIIIGVSLSCFSLLILH